MVEYKGFTIGITSVAIVAGMCIAGVGHANSPAEGMLAKDGGATVNSFELAGKDGGRMDLAAKDGGRTVELAAKDGGKTVEFAAKDSGKTVELSATETADFLTAAKDGGGWELAAKDGGKATPAY